jgi:hypothetical protein
VVAPDESCQLGPRHDNHHHGGKTSQQPEDRSLPRRPNWNAGTHLNDHAGVGLRE